MHSETFEVVNFHDSLQLKLTKKKQDIQEEKKKGPWHWVSMEKDSSFENKENLAS